MFDMDREFNVPTFFSSGLMLGCALVLWVIALASRAAKDGLTGYWSVLAWGFLFMSLDDAVVLHEKITRPLRLLTHSDAFYMRWMLPATVLIAILGAFYIKFLAALPRRSRMLFLVSAVIFLGAAVGLETFTSWLGFHGQRPETMLYVILVMIEESVELAGITLFLYALLDHIRRALPGLRALVGEDVEAMPPLAIVGRGDAPVVEHAGQRVGSGR